MAILKKGSKGNEVTTLQNNLKKLGYAISKADGIFGAETDAAVKKFQSKQGLKADGIVGPATQSKITEKLKMISNVPTQKPVTKPEQKKEIIKQATITNLLKKGFKGNEVTTLQNNLKKLGYSISKADGIFGAETDAAVKKFQSKQGLNPDGIVGAMTQNKIIEKLNMVSNIPEPIKPIPGREAEKRIPETNIVIKQEEEKIINPLPENNISVITQKEEEEKKIVPVIEKKTITDFPEPKKENKKNIEPEPERKNSNQKSKSNNILIFALVGIGGIGIALATTGKSKKKR